MVLASTRLGQVRGVDKDGVFSFLGIPYAAPPVGELRWRPPAPPSAWSGVYDATKHPNRAFQIPFPEDLAPPGGIPGEMSEDMLYLNVHTPAADGKRRPVMFYIHGGGYTMGSANDFDPSPFAARNDIVIVAINYRLGLFGFFDLSRFGPEYQGSANLGFQDQIAAMRWVADNIADYGGDPANVTLLGCSAGGGSVLAMMSAPSAKGLFVRAVAMSPLEISRSPPDIVASSAAALQMSDEAAFGHLRSLSGEALFGFQLTSGAGVTASVDGTVIVQPTAAAIEAGINRAPLLTGCTIAEGPMLTAGVQKAMGTDPAVYRMIEAGYSTNIGAGDAARYTAFLDALAADFTPEQRLDRAWFDCFRSYTLTAAQAVSDSGTPCWVYTFAVPTDHHYGPTHGSDVSFVLDAIRDTAEGEMRAYYRNNAANRAIALLWSRAFVRFMRSGDPNGEGLPTWPQYERRSRSCLVLGDTPVVVNNPDGQAALAAYGLV